jgi:hypothetical protein
MQAEETRMILFLASTVVAPSIAVIGHGAPDAQRTVKGG